MLPFLAFSAVIVSSQQAEAPADVKARKILAEMKSVYASCNTYQDVGTARCGDSSISFNTVFRRPNKLLVQFKDDKDPKGYAFWIASPRGINTKGKRKSIGYIQSVLLDITENKPELDDLEVTLAGATGISYGGATTVPGFLFPKKAYGFCYVETKDFIFQKQQRIGNVLCDQISSEKWSLDAWIACDSHLMVREVTKAGNIVYQVDFHPKINEKIPDSRFRLKLPHNQLEK